MKVKKIEINRWNLKFAEPCKPEGTAYVDAPADEALPEHMDIHGFHCRVVRSTPEFSALVGRARKLFAQTGKCPHG